MVIDTIPESERLERVFATLQGSSEALGVSTGRLQKMIKSGDVKARKVGWMWLLHRDELERLAIELGITKEPVLV